MGEGEDKELKDSSLMKQPECNKGEGEGEDKELKDFEPEPESDIKGLEEDDLSEDDLLDDYGSSCRYEGYYGFDASGKRWYEVSLVDEKNQDYHKALLLDVLKWDSCKSIYRCKANHLFEARMSEEEADKVAGLEEVEYVEPRRYIFHLD
ncbi:hypothetical protein GOBAR_DD13650 [Gossypium barbadense]|nr:hypothetical protein GOBAR_DD13650 [Gossypium barbadense]